MHIFAMYHHYLHTHYCIMIIPLHLAKYLRYTISYLVAFLSLLCTIVLSNLTWLLSPCKHALRPLWVSEPRLNDRHLRWSIGGLLFLLAASKSTIFIVATSWGTSEPIGSTLRARTTCAPRPNVMEWLQRGGDAPHKLGTPNTEFSPNAQWRQIILFYNTLQQTYLYPCLPYTENTGQSS